MVVGGSFLYIILSFHLAHLPHPLPSPPPVGKKEISICIPGSHPASILDLMQKKGDDDASLPSSPLCITTFVRLITAALGETAFCIKERIVKVERNFPQICIKQISPTCKFNQGVNKKKCICIFYRYCVFYT